MKTNETYEKPEIVFEGELEIQAGSPVSLMDDPFFGDGL